MSLLHQNDYQTPVCVNDNQRPEMNKTAVNSTAACKML